MVYSKTKKGRHALQNKLSLSVAERQVLVLCNGKRATTELREIFAQDLDAILARLQALGLILSRESTRQIQGDFSVTGTFLTDSQIQTIGPVIQDAPSRAPSSFTYSGSLAQVRASMVSMLKRLRGQQAMDVASALDGVSAEHDTIALLATLIELVNTQLGADRARAMLRQISRMIPSHTVVDLVDCLLNLDLVDLTLELYEAALSDREVKTDPQEPTAPA